MAIRRHAVGGTLGHALKGQKLLAQGNALGFKDVANTPCKGKSFKTSSKKYKAFALTGRIGYILKTQGVALG